MSHPKKVMISFFLTTKCNLDCVYCYTNKHKYKHQTLDFKFAQLGVDDFFKSNNSRHIRFFGAGEPTMEFELMKKIREYAYEKAGNKLLVETQTNGVFSITIAKWLSDNIDIIWVSLDGVPDIQNHYRPTITGKPTSDVIERNIKYLIRKGTCMVGIRSTINNMNLYNQIDNIRYFASLGVKYIWTDPMFPTVGEKDAYEEIDILEYAKEYLKAKKYADKHNIFYGSFLTCNFDEKTKYHCRACLPVPHLTTDGYVSACDMALFGANNNHMSVFIYGKWDRGNNKIIYDEEKINYIKSRNVDNMPGCNNCIAKYHCGGYCLGEVMNETHNLFGKKERVCEPIRYLMRNMQTNMGCYKYLHP